jgi:hypothetical protein
MTPRRALAVLFALIGLLMSALAAVAYASPLSDDGGAEWRVEQPEAPARAGSEGPSGTTIGLGKIGDISFYQPNRGALITAGNGTAVKPGVWLYNGQRWRELATQCGATDGRIVWSGPNEFWTISDGRPGQAEANGVEPPLEDNTLCHFAPGAGGTLEIVGSYASLAFESSSYQPMNAAACISSDDCWFAGDTLPAPQIGAFQLHWNGQRVAAEPYLPEGHIVRGLAPFEGRLYESVQLQPGDKVIKTVLPPPALRAINPEGTSPTFANVEEPDEQHLLYPPGEVTSYLEALSLGAGENSLWAAAGPSSYSPAGPEYGATILRYSKLRYSPGSEVPTEEPTAAWSQVLGPKTDPSGYETFNTTVRNAVGEEERAAEGIGSIASEPESDAAWLALTPKGENPESQQALVARITADGTVSDKLTLPQAIEQPGQRYGPLGAAETMVCPGAHDCWLTTAKGWLLHLSQPGQERLPEDNDPVFALSQPIEIRPADEGVPQVAANEGPVAEEATAPSTKEGTGSVIQPIVNQFAEVALPLLSKVRSRLVKGTTLELSFHLAVRAKIRLIAKRRRAVVASTPMRTLRAGNRRLLLKLNIHRWPTKLDLETHALAPLPKTSTRESNVNSVSTSLAFPGRAGLLGSGILP